jgi:hypothetical protein
MSLTEGKKLRYSRTQPVRNCFSGMIHRRHFLCAIATPPLAAVALFVPTEGALAQQMSDKPTVKLSEVMPALTLDVEQMAQDVKERTGIELSTDQKTKMLNAMLTQMKAQDTYVFVDP